MKKQFIFLCYFFIAIAITACSSSSTAKNNFSYPSALALGYLPVSNVRTLYIANTFTGTISEINTSTNSVMPVTTSTGTTNAIPLNMYPEAIEYDNGYLYVAGFTQTSGLLESLNLSTNQTTSTVYLKGYPYKILLNNSTSTLYVIGIQNNKTYLESFTASSTITPATAIILSFTPSSITLTPDSSNLLISYQNQAFISVLDPVTLAEVNRINTDYPVALMGMVNQYEDTMLYAVVFTTAGYSVESINTSNGSTGYEFTVPGVPADFAISTQRMLLDDNHFSYLGVIANANGYVHFINIDYGCQIPSIPSSHTGVTLTSTIPASNAPSIQAITTNDCKTQSEAWSITYNSSTKDYDVTGTASGPQSEPAKNGAFFKSAHDSVSFYVNPGTSELNNNDKFTFGTTAAAGIKILSGFGLPQHILVDPLTNQAYVSDILTNSLYVVSLSSQSITAIIR